MHKLKQKAVLTLATAAMAAGSVVGSSPAEAVATPAAACGSNYHEIDHHDLGSVATVHLLYNGTTDCVVTLKKVDLGTPTSVYAIVAVAGDPYVSQEGQYKYYAGPVKVNAPHKCIVWGGAADPGWILWYSDDPDHPGSAHCG